MTARPLRQHCNANHPLRTPIATAALGAALLACSAVTSPQDPPMTPATPDIFAEVGLPDTAFFALDEASKERLRLAAGDHDWRGVVLGAPRRIVVGEHAEVPVLALAQDGFVHRSTIHWHAASHLVAVDLHTGVAHLRGLSVREPEPGVDERPARSDPTPEPPPPAMQKAIVCSVDRVDLVKLVGPLEHASRFAVCVVAADLRSPVLEVRVEGPERTTQGLDAAAAHAALESLRDARSQSLVQPGISFPSNDLPPGVHLSVPSSWKPGDAPVLLEGSIHVRPGAGQFVSEAARGTEPELPLAFARALCLVAERDTGRLAPIPLEAPIHTGTRQDLEQGLQMRFSAELIRLFPEGLRSTHYDCYLVAGDQVTGPHSVHVDR